MLAQLLRSWVGQGRAAGGKELPQVARQPEEAGIQRSSPQAALAAAVRVGVGCGQQGLSPSPSVDSTVTAGATGLALPPAQVTCGGVVLQGGSRLGHCLWG